MMFGPFPYLQVNYSFVNGLFSMFTSVVEVDRQECMPANFFLPHGIYA